MTPDQKDAFRREVQEAFDRAQYVPGDHPVIPVKLAQLMDDLRRALAASQPAPAADTGQAVAWTLSDLHRANIERQEAWCPDQKPDLSFRGNELAGEVGEACNVIKKLERKRQGWAGSRDTLDHLAEELADVIICADLCAVTAGVDLQAAVIAKWNATSEKVGLPHRLVPTHLAPLDADLGRKIGDSAVHHLQEMYPAALRAVPATAVVSLRNHITNQIIAALRQKEGS